MWELNKQQTKNNEGLRLADSAKSHDTLLLLSLHVTIRLVELLWQFSAKEIESELRQRDTITIFSRCPPKVFSFKFRCVSADLSGTTGGLAAEFSYFDATSTS